jgi:hypothetical protein
MNNVRIDHTYTIILNDGEDNELSFTEQPCFIPDTTDTLRSAYHPGTSSAGGYVTPTPETTRVAWLCYDADVGDFWSDRDSGTYVEFRGHDEFPDPIIADLIEEHGLGRVFPVSAYDAHGPGSFCVDILDRVDQWHRADAVYICPDDVPVPADYAAAVLAEYATWCNGEVYGVVCRTLDADGNVSDREECWGYIGFEYAMSEVDGFVGADDATIGGGR